MWDGGGVAALAAVAIPTGGPGRQEPPASSLSLQGSGHDALRTTADGAAQRPESLSFSHRQLPGPENPSQGFVEVHPPGSSFSCISSPSQWQRGAHRRRF